MAIGKGLARTTLILALVVLVSACGKGREDDTYLEDLTAQQIYQAAEFQLNSRDYTKAAQLFSEVERLFPYSEWAKRGIVMSAFSYHKEKNYDESRSAAQRYLDFYPADDDAAYAAYLMALSYYDQIDDVGRDQGNTFQALQALRVVIERYPDSSYAKSAILKFDLALDHLAGKEMEIGRYYLKRGHFTAAINRFRVVVEEFQTSTHTPEALHRLVEAYLSLGLAGEAQTAGAILGHNFQSTDWYEDSYKLLTSQGLEPKGNSEGWLKKVYNRVIKGTWI